MLKDIASYWIHDWKPQNRSCPIRETQKEKRQAATDWQQPFIGRVTDVLLLPVLRRANRDFTRGTFRSP